MNTQDKDQFSRFSRALVGLGEVFTKEITPALLETYARALSDIEIEKIEFAAGRFIQEGRFFPKPVELRELSGGSAGKLEDRAEVEAAKLLEAMSSVGGYQSVVFDDPVTQAVVEKGLGGWVRLCSEHRCENDKWLMKDFVRIYCAYQRQGIKSYGSVAGRFEIDNGFRGYKRDVYPALVGCEQKALANYYKGKEQEALQENQNKELMSNFIKRVPKGYEEEF